MLPDLRSESGFDSLKAAGYVNEFAQPKDFKQQAQLIELAVDVASNLTQEQAIISDTANLVLDSLLMPPPGFEFFARFPKEEVKQFCRLAVDSRLRQKSLFVVCPVCPDSFQYQLSDGVGDIGAKALQAIPIFADFFAKRNFAVEVDIHVADVEALDDMVVVASGETVQSHLAKTAVTRQKLKQEIDERGLSTFVSVSSMLAEFHRQNLDYRNQQKKAIYRLPASDGKKIRKTITALLQERKSLKNFDLINPIDHEAMVIAELAGYVAYGQMVAGQALILSPDAMSSIPAYNFFQGDHQVNPVVYVKNVKSNRTVMW